MGIAQRDEVQSNPFQAALLSVAIVLIAIGLLTFGMATARATPSPLYPDAAAEALPSLVWGGAIIAVGFVAFLFWLLVSALRWKPSASRSFASATGEVSVVKIVSAD